MEKWNLIRLMAAVLVVLSGCNGSGTPAESSANSGQAKESALSSQVEEADVPEGSRSEAPSGDREEQAFTSLELDVREGTLYIRAGESFSLTRRGGEKADYEIKDDVLYFSDSRGGEAVLTVPEQDGYEALLLTVENGHVYAEDPLTLQTLELELDRGEAKLEEVSVAGSSRIAVEQGTAFLSGDLGAAVSASCREGRLDLEVPFAQGSCNYELAVSQGNIRLGYAHYSGRSDSRSVDNGGDRSMELTCTRGDISVEFEK